MEVLDSFKDMIPEEPTLEDAAGREDVLKHLTEAREKSILFHKLKDSPDWKLEKEKEGATMHLMSYEDSGVYAFRIELEINCTPEALIKLESDTEKIKAMDESCKEFYDIEVITPYLRYTRSVTAGNLLVSDRDFVAFKAVMECPDDSYMLSQHSVELESVPEDKNCVRGWISIYCAHIQEIGPKKIKMTKVGHADPKGMVPSTFVNLVLSNQLDGHLELKKTLESS